MSTLYVEPTSQPKLANMIAKRTTIVNKYGRVDQMPPKERGIYYHLCRQIQERCDHQLE
jgi:hypothetical protein